jgi:hypothetical protein
LAARSSLSGLLDRRLGARVLRERRDYVGTFVRSTSHTESTTDEKDRTAESDHTGGSGGHADLSLVPARQPVASCCEAFRQAILLSSRPHPWSFS